MCIDGCSFTLASAVMDGPYPASYIHLRSRPRTTTSMGELCPAPCYLYISRSRSPTLPIALSLTIYVYLVLFLSPYIPLSTYPPILPNLLYLTPYSPLPNQHLLTRYTWEHVPHMCLIRCELFDVRCVQIPNFIYNFANTEIPLKAWKPSYLGV